MRSLRLSGRVGAIVGLIMSVAFSGGPIAPVVLAQPNAQLTDDFEDRVKAYVTLRGKVDGGAPKQQQTKDSAKIQEAQRALAVLIRNARAGAKQGDIFGPATEKRFRALLNPEVKGADGAKTRATILDEKPAVELKINAGYPAAQPLSTVPPDVLQALPPLPKDQDLEYRFVGKHLILLDTRANLIVDFVFNAIP